MKQPVNIKAKPGSTTRNNTAEPSVQGSDEPRKRRDFRAERAIHHQRYQRRVQLLGFLGIASSDNPRIALHAKLESWLSDSTLTMFGITQASSKHSSDFPRGCPDLS
jgi:hypothetical protein